MVSELAEAAARTGDAGLVRTALESASVRARVTPTPWALGIEARARALLSSAEAADNYYRESIGHLAGTRMRSEVARAHLLYGEWLRRENRRVDAREQLRTAREMLDAMGMEAFAERARRELLATGESVRKRAAEASSALTAQETAIARLARDGRTNPEIGAQLFLSAHGRMAPAQHLHQTRHRLPPRAARRAGATRARRRARPAEGLNLLAGKTEPAD